MIAESLGHVDPVIAHTFRALALLEPVSPVFYLDHRGAAPEQKKLLPLHDEDASIRCGGRVAAKVEPVPGKP